VASRISRLWSSVRGMEIKGGRVKEDSVIGGDFILVYRFLSVMDGIQVRG